MTKAQMVAILASGDIERVAAMVTALERKEGELTPGEFSALLMGQGILFESFERTARELGERG